MAKTSEAKIPETKISGTKIPGAKVAVAKYPGGSAPRKKSDHLVVFGQGTAFNGFLRFKETLCIRGKFKGTIEASGDLIVDKGATVEADRISVASLVVYGSVAGAVYAVDKVDMLPGAEVKGDVSAARLRIADGVLFEGQCSMTGVDKDVEIFSRPTEEIKAEFQRLNG